MQWSKPSLETTPNYALIEEQSRVVGPTQSPPMWADGGPQRTTDLASYMEIPFMHKRLIVTGFLIGAMVSWAAILLLPKSYESQAMLVLQVGRESVALDPSATTSATLTLQKTQEEEVVSALEIISSRQVAHFVVEKLGPDAIIHGRLPGGESVKTAPSTLTSFKSSLSSVLADTLLKAGIKDEISNHELAVMRLQSSVSIHSPKKSTVLGIKANSKTPEMAQAIVKAYTDTFLEEHSKASRTDGSFEFFRQQSSDMQERLGRLVDERARFMQEREMVSLDSGRDFMQKRQVGIDRDLVVAAGELRQATSEIADLQLKFAETDDEIIATKQAGTDSTWSGMRQQVYELELSEQNLAANHTDTHPKLRQIRKQLYGAQEILAKLDSERIDESTTPNPIKVSLQQELQRQQTRLVGLRSMIDEKQSQQNALQGEIEKLLEDERRLTQIDRDIRVMESSLQRMLEKLEEARIIAGLQAQKISNVHVFQPATFVERASSPNKKTLVAGCLFLGLMSGLALCFVCQSSSQTLRTAEDVEYSLDLPVIAKFPMLKRMHSPQSTEQNRYRRKYQSLVSDIMLSPRFAHRNRGRSVGIISVAQGAGASTLSANLAVSSGVDHRLRTVLVDADPRERSISKMFGLNGSPGLIELTHGIASHDECLQRAHNSPIDLVASASDTCHERLTASAPEITQALRAYLEDCDLLIVDLPAADQPDQAVAIAQHLDCVLVVVESEKTLSLAAERLIRHLTQSDTEIVGVVLNKSINYLPTWIGRFISPQFA